MKGQKYFNNKKNRFRFLCRFTIAGTIDWQIKQLNYTKLILQKKPSRKKYTVLHVEYRSDAKTISKIFLLLAMSVFVFYACIYGLCFFVPCLLHKCERERERAKERVVVRKMSFSNVRHKKSRIKETVRKLEKLIIFYYKLRLYTKTVFFKAG